MTPATANSEHAESRKTVGGVLYKWTNYVSGWQPRYFEISNGSLVYYKSKGERSAGCRGSIALKSARIELIDDFGKCEFTVRVSEDIVWYLKADSAAMRERWHRRLIADHDSDYSSKGHSRTPSAASSTYSQQQLHSPTGDGKRAALVSERLLELGGYRELCASQMAEIEKELEELQLSAQHPAAPPLSRAKLLTLKATHIAMLANVDRILQLAGEQTEMVQVHARPVAMSAPPTGRGEEKEREDRVLASISSSTMVASAPSPAHSSRSANGVTSDDEDLWHDADEERTEREGSGREEEERKGEERVEENGETAVEDQPDVTPPPAVAHHGSNEKDNEGAVVDRHLPFGCFDSVLFSDAHSLAPGVHELTNSQLDYALNGAQDPTMWTLFASDGEMKMYKREIEQDGLPVDPLKALHSVKGVSALEFMHYFFDARYKMGWDHTLDQMRVIETIAEDLVVVHQKHKTVWPAAPRESLFWSHLRRVDHRKSDGAHDCYVVCNKDIQRADVPLGSSSAVRVGLTVSMICETFVDNPENLPLSQLPRSAFTCKVIYVSSVHPGGWVPTGALRQVFKREYPKFLRTFTAFVLEKVKRNQQVAI
ncbi:hypothetical protein PFISCL1PPCAC_18372 [Pristionchus fissidentatus]|uniref:Collagen type IV alpha-3-binding protein n=1 Tax=Pristionchus fissidentatus TaxID=1538716 RepID=A0AAV5W9L2_9BILA|nr:hypothetical protein PFISCL1PPCAC_18372 [Pristionchus fissidentatus]